MALSPEQQAEIEKTVAESFARQEAREAQRRKREGGVELCLERAPDDAGVGDPAFQEELGEFSKSLRATGMSFSQSIMVFDAVDGGGFPLPAYAVQLGVPFITGVAGLCGAWIQARYGRKVRLKIGDIEAEGRSIREIEALLERAEQFQASVRDKGEEAQ